MKDLLQAIKDYIWSLLTRSIPDKYKKKASKFTDILINQIVRFTKSNLRQNQKAIDKAGLYSIIVSILFIYIGASILASYLFLIGICMLQLNDSIDAYYNASKKIKRLSWLILSWGFWLTPLIYLVILHQKGMLLNDLLKLSPINYQIFLHSFMIALLGSAGIHVLYISAQILPAFIFHLVKQIIYLILKNKLLRSSVFGIVYCYMKNQIQKTVNLQ